LPAGLLQYEKNGWILPEHSADSIEDISDHSGPELTSKYDISKKKQGTETALLFLGV